MGLLAQVVVDDVTATGPAGQAEVDVAVEAARPQEGRVEVGGPVGRPDDQNVGRGLHRPRQATVDGQPDVDGVDHGPFEPQRGGRLLEGLELDQQLVDHPGDALTVMRRSGATSGPDGIQLLDEADRPAFVPGMLAQRLEEGPYLAVGLAIEHGLERRRRDEQKGDAGFGGHGLGHVGLAGSRRSFEQDRLTRRSTHLLGEGPMGQKEVEGLGDLLHQRLRPPDIVEAHGQFVGTVEDVG